MSVTFEGIGLYVEPVNANSVLANLTGVVSWNSAQVQSTVFADDDWGSNRLDPPGHVVVGENESTTEIEPDQPTTTNETDIEEQ